MVFRQKLQGSDRPQRSSVRSIAKQYGVTVARVREALDATGEHVASDAARRIEQPVVRQICEHLSLPYMSAPVNPIAAWELKTTDLASFPKKRVSKERQTPTQTQVTIVRPKDKSAGLGFPRHDASDAFADESWKLFGFSEVEKDLWIEAGLRRGQAKEARELAGAGLSPTDLNRGVEGWTVAKRLRAGEAPIDVVNLLRRSKHGDSAC